MAYSYSRRGFTIIELIAYIFILGIFSTGIYTAVNKVSIGQKKAVLSSAVQNTQNLAMQNFVKTDKLKASLALALGSTQMNDLEECFNSLGTDCDTKFGTLQLPLTLNSSDPLAKDITGSFSNDLSKCADPNNCKKSFEQQVIANILCPSDVSCTEVKLRIAAQSTTNPELALAPRNIEINVPAITFTNSGLKGLCATNEGYINSINIGNNTLDCAPANSALNPAPLNNDCGDAKFENGRILAGLGDSGISGSNNCQSVPVSNWANSAVGYPSSGNLLPSIQKVIPLNAPRVSTQSIEGDIILILDDSKSLTKARTEVAKGIRNLVDRIKNKQSSLRITGFTTDTLAPNKASEPPKRIIPEAGIKFVTTTVGSGADQVDTTTYSLNDPFIDLTINKNTENAGELLEKTIVNFPYAEGEENESAACTILRHIAEDNGSTHNRKKVFLMFSDELDAFKNYPMTLNLATTCLSSRNTNYYESIRYVVERYYSKYLDGFKAQEDEKFESVRPPEADLKTILYMGVQATFTVKYKKWLGDIVTESSRSFIAPYFIAKDYNIDPSLINANNTRLKCTEDLQNDLTRYFKDYIISERDNDNGNMYYKVKASETEKSSIDLDGCWIEKSQVFIANKVLESFSSKENFYSYRPNFNVEFNEPGIVYQKPYEMFPIASKAIYNNSYNPYITTHELKNETYAQYKAEKLDLKFKPFIIPEEIQVNYYLRKGWAHPIQIWEKPTDEPYTVERQIWPREDWGTSIVKTVSEKLNLKLDYNLGMVEAQSAFLSDALKKNYGDMFAFVGMVHTKDSSSACNGERAEKNDFFIDLASRVPRNNANITDFCDFDKYDDAFENIENFLSTSDVDYSYEVTLDSDTIATLKLFLESHEISEVPVQVSLLLNPDSSAPPDLIKLSRDTDFSFEIQNINTSQPKFFVHFTKNNQITNYLSTFKHIKVNIGQ